jgi:hypothetical protein
LRPLVASERQSRLTRALAAHRDWPQVRGDLDRVLTTYGEGNHAGRRQGQVHLTLSRAGLENGFNHYLTHGSEFDQHAAHALLGDEGKELLRRYGRPILIKVKVPGEVALARISHTAD